MLSMWQVHFASDEKVSPRCLWLFTGFIGVLLNTISKSLGQLPMNSSSVFVGLNEKERGCCGNNLLTSYLLREFNR